ncbi:hypothetical protein SF285071_1259 [Shigella flexneri 2850-71]|nr:hypothetical protein SF285071_1259 [Shigella flexneri 2850-71]
MRAEIALMSGSAFAVTHHAFSSGAGRTSDGNGSHASTLKSPSYTKSVSWQHYPVLSEVASGVMNTKTKGKVSLNLEIEPFDENRVKIKHKLSYVRPTNRGKISEEDTTETPMYVNRGGRLTILQEDQGQLLTLAGEPDGKLRAAGH